MEDGRRKMEDEETKPPHWQSWEAAAVPALPQMAVSENLDASSQSCSVPRRMTLAGGASFFANCLIWHTVPPYCPLPLLVVAAVATAAAAARLHSRSKAAQVVSELAHGSARGNSNFFASCHGTCAAFSRKSVSTSVGHKTGR